MSRAVEFLYTAQVYLTVATICMNLINVVFVKKLHFIFLTGKIWRGLIGYIELQNGSLLEKC